MGIFLGKKWDSGHVMDWTGNYSAYDPMTTGIDSTAVSCIKWDSEMRMVETYKSKCFIKEPHQTTHIPACSDS